MQVFHASCDGRIADKPAGPRALGWDRLCGPAGFDGTYAELVADPAAAVDAIGLRAGPYRALLAAMS